MSEQEDLASRMGGDDLAAVRRLYKAAAISNFAVTIPAFVSYKRYVGAFAKEPPNYPFLVWLWSGMAFLWGLSFWEISKDPVKNEALIKYSYLEKTVTASSVTTAFARGNVPGKFVAAVSYTDTIWIPLFILAHRRVRAAKQRADGANA